MNEQETVFIGLGTNLGDREKNLRQALEHIQAFIDIERSSSIYETEPVGYEDQDWFLNMVVEGHTRLSPLQLLRKLQEIENRIGRKRTIKNGPRIIDLDILFYSDKVLTAENLIIPHPAIQNRSFVLTPLHEIEPDFVHPKLNRDIKSLFETLSQDKHVKKWIKKE